jgi:branched-chain amino acid transport system ATP-binding protein
VTRDARHAALHRRRRSVIPDPAAVFQADGLRKSAGGRHIRAQSKRSEVAHACAVILERTELFDRANATAGGCRCLSANVWNWPAPWRPIRSCLLLDEIAGGLTEAECLSLIETIKAIHAEGVTIIWIEHVLHALNSVVERLLVLDFGKVIGIGEPAAIMESKEVREIYLGIEV